MKRPLTVILIYFISGALAGQYIQDDTGIVLFFMTGLLSSAALFIIYKWNKVFWFVLAMLAGFLSVWARNLPNYTLIEESAQKNLSVSIDALVIKPQPPSGFIAETKTDKVKILVYSDTEIIAGDTVIITGTARPLSVQRNPGGFDEKMYYAARGVKYKMYPEYVAPTGHEDSLISRIYTLREALSGVYDLCLPEKEAGIMKSIIIGDRSQLFDEVKYLYSAAGIYHILAISGLHISIIGLFINTLLRLFLSKRSSGVVTLVLLVLYCLLTGASPSTVRAVAMCASLIIGRIIFRMNDPITSLSTAALCILIYNPFYLWDLGFQLSFSAMVGILLLNEPFEILFKLLSSKKPFLKSIFENFWIKQGLVVSVAVFIFTVPVGTSYLSSINVYSILVNVIIFPTFFLLVSAGFLTGCAGLCWLPAAEFLSGILYYLLNLYEIILNFFVSLPFSRLLTGYIPLYITIPYYLFLGLCAYYLKHLPNSKNIKKYLFASLSLFAAAVCIRVFAPRPLEVTMLDVSQGDSFVISKDGFTTVIDGGGWLNVETGKNTGVKILVPYLDYLGVVEVDIAVATHLDQDHAAGIIELMKAKNVKILCIPANTPTDTTLYKEIIETAAEYGVQLKLLKKGDVYTNRDVSFTCLNPMENTEHFDQNYNSVVLKLEYKSISFLFTGDITEQTEKELISDPNITAQVLKLAHHGSKYSNSEEFLDAVSPGLAIVSYSKYNTYGHVSDEMKQRLIERNIPLLQTAEHGAVILISDGKNIRVKRSVR